MSPFQVRDAHQVRVVVADELAEDRQRAGELLDGLGSQHGRSHVEIGAKSAADLRRSDGGKTGLAGGGSALAALLRGDLDHAGLEEKTTEPEQLASPASSHWFGQSGRRIDVPPAWSAAWNIGAACR
jgi:hypothetical protein